MNRPTSQSVGVFDDAAELTARRFLDREAEALDTRDFHGWLALLSREIKYRVPVRTTKSNKDGPGFSERAFFLDEDYASLHARVVRLDSEYAWSENPATRTRRLVGNIRIRAVSPAMIQCASNLALFCYRGDAGVPTILTAEREDVVVKEHGVWKLVSRMALLDTTVLGMESLSVFI